MGKIVAFSLIVFLFGCSGKPNVASEYSELGSLNLEKSELVLLDNSDNILEISNFIEGISSDNLRKNYIFVEIETLDAGLAATTAEMVESRLRDKPFIHYEVRHRLVSGAEGSAKQVIRAKKLFFKPRACAPTEKRFLERSGGYNGLEFGCAYANNIGAMVDNPRDIIGPRGSESINSQRTMRMLRAFIAGEATGSALPENEAGEASEVTSSD